MNPQIYVLDEPSANLDHEAMGKLRRILEIVKKGGHTVLIAEHRCQLVSEGRRKQRPHAERHSGIFHRKYLPASASSACHTG